MKIVIDIPEGMLDELRTCKFPIQEAYRLCAVIENGKPATCIYREVLQMMDNLDWGGSVTGDNESWQALKGWLTEQMDGGDEDESV